MQLLESFDWCFSSDNFQTSTKYLQWTLVDYSHVGISNCVYIVYTFCFYYLSYVLFYHKTIANFCYYKQILLFIIDFVGDITVENRQYCVIKKSEMTMNILTINNFSKSRNQITRLNLQRQFHSYTLGTVKDLHNLQWLLSFNFLFLPKPIF